MIAYLLLTNISRMFSSMPGLAGGIAREIREGTMKRYLIQPIDMIGYLLVYRVAHKVTYIIMSFIPYALLFFLCRGFFDGFPDAPTLAAFAVSLILSFLVGFFFEASVGMVGFWFLEVTSLLYIVMTLNFFISGHMLPLDLLPQPWVELAQGPAVPVHGLFPGRRLPGQGQGDWTLVLHLLVELFWAVFFMVLARGLYRHGPAALQRLRRLKPWHLRRYGRYFRLLGQPGPLHAQPRAGVPGQLPGQGLGRGALAGDPGRLLPHGLRHAPARSPAGPSRSISSSSAASSP